MTSRHASSTFSLAVIATILLLIAAGVWAWWKSTHDDRGFTRHDRVRADIVMISMLLRERAAQNNGHYPDTLAELLQPTVGSGYLLSIADPWGRDYSYAPPLDSKSGCVATLGADGRTGGVGDDEDVDNLTLHVLLR